MFKNVSIRKRLGLVLGTILLLSLVTSGFAVLKLRALGTHIDHIVNDQLLVERAASEWLMHTTAGVQRAAAIAKSSDTALVDYFAPATATSVGRTTELQKFIEARMDLPSETALFEVTGSYRPPRRKLERAAWRGACWARHGRPGHPDPSGTTAWCSRGRARP